MLGESLSVEPHETRRTHVLEEGLLVVIGHVFPIGVVLAVFAKEMSEVTLLFVATEIQADAGSVLEGAPIGQSLCGRSPLLDMEEAHLEALVGELLTWLFLAAFLLFAVRLALAVRISFGRLSRGVCRRLFSDRRSVNEPPPAVSAKKPCAKAGTSLGKELSSMCSCIFEKNFNANLTAVTTILVSKSLLPNSILFVLMEFCEKDARCMKTW